MTLLGAHSNTSQAVKATIEKITTKLKDKFSFLPNIPDFFYDINRDFDVQFKQYYAEIPIDKRQNPWIALLYSYDTASLSSVQPRVGLRFYRDADSLSKRAIDFAYTDLPVLFSIITNDSKILNAISTYLLIEFKLGFSTKFTDLLWPEWIANTYYPLGFYIRPTNYNGFLYQCTTEGISDSTEPDWIDKKDSVQVDNNAIWKCITPHQLTVKAFDFVKNNTVITNPIDGGVMFKYEFGYTLHYVDMEDAGVLTGIVKDITCKLFQLYNDTYGELLDTIEVSST
jgi:hypothetical protein